MILVIFILLISILYKSTRQNSSKIIKKLKNAFFCLDRLSKKVLKKNKIKVFVSPFSFLLVLLVKYNPPTQNLEKRLKNDQNWTQSATGLS